MTSRHTGARLLLPVVWSIAACNGGDVAVFSDAVAGNSAGSAGSSGSLGSAARAGSGAGGAVAGSSGAPAGSIELGEAGASDAICHSNMDCDSSSFCLKGTCEAFEGTCVTRPMVCFNTAPDPVCGCNHVIYWNDCLRQQSGIAASTPGECLAGAHSCYTSVDCGSRATCSHLLGPDADCGGPVNAGACWVTPNDCSATGDMKLWSSCPPPGNSSGGAAECVTTCRAIQLGRPFMQLLPGAACP